MGNQLLNESFIRQRSSELQIPFENLLAAAILEEIIQRVGESDYGENFWLKNSVCFNLENYRKKVNRKVSYFIKETDMLHYKKIEISNVFAELFRNIKKDAIHWNYKLWKEQNVIFANMTAMIASIKVPVKMEFEQVLDESLHPYRKEIHLFNNNNKKMKLNCFPIEYVLVEKFLNVMEKMELINDLSNYMDIYEILKRESLSGRKVWELLNEGCSKHGIEIEKQRFEILVSYRTNQYMKKKWKSYLRHEKKISPVWNEVMEMIEVFFSNIWTCMCENLIYLGDWMPELGRFID